MSNRSVTCIHTGSVYICMRCVCTNAARHTRMYVHEHVNPHCMTISRKSIIKPLVLCCVYNGYYGRGELFWAGIGIVLVLDRLGTIYIYNMYMYIHLCRCCAYDVYNWDGCRLIQISFIRSTYRQHIVSTQSNNDALLKKKRKGRRTWETLISDIS